MLLPKIKITRFDHILARTGVENVPMIGINAEMIANMRTRSGLEIL